MLVLSILACKGGLVAPPDNLPAFAFYMLLARGFAGGCKKRLVFAFILSALGAVIEHWLQRDLASMLRSCAPQGV